MAVVAVSILAFLIGVTHWLDTMFACERCVVFFDTIAPCESHAPVKWQS